MKLNVFRGGCTVFILLSISILGCNDPQSDRDKEKAQSVSKETVIGPGTTLRGEFVQPGFDPYPMILTITRFTNNQLEGTLEWPTLGGSVSRFQGKHIDGDWEFTEYEQIEGGRGNLLIPCYYKGKQKNNTVIGTAGGTIQGQGITITGSFSIQVE